MTKPFSISAQGTRFAQGSGPHRMRAQPQPLARGGRVRMQEAEVYPVPERVANAHVPDMETYRSLWEESVHDPDAFFGKAAKEYLTWRKDFDKVLDGNLVDGDVNWFSGGELNICENCIDRHPKDNVAIIWEGDTPDLQRSITYGELLQEVSRLANALKRRGVSKGDRVCIYMPMVPEAAFAMLACARIGAIHSVVFAGFSAEALRARILDSECKVLITADEGVRGGKAIGLKNIADEALGGGGGCACVESVLVHKRTGAEVGWGSRDEWLHEAMAAERPHCPAETMQSEDPFFLLYTSGSTGMPKGMQHTTAGYLLWAAMTHKNVFDYRPGEVYACMADVGWITGHTYILYGPLSNGATTFMFEGTPTFPTASRYWEMVERHKISSFYTAPTAIRALMRFGTEPLEGFDLSSLRVLGTVGEPINPEAWRWYHGEVGGGKCAVVDTFWQTETGGHMLTPLPGCTPTKPGSATLPFFGVKPEVLEPTTGEQLEGMGVEGVCAFSKPWPGMARTIWKNHERYMDTYLKPYPGYYFTGDGCLRDDDGYYWITGRVDDVLNVAGHRIGTAEIESALVLHESCVEAAVVGIPDDIKGQAIVAYVTLAQGFEDSEEIEKVLIKQVRSEIGAICTPKQILCTSGLPKTRSGKIMRRVLRKIASSEVTQENIADLGDISTLADPSLVPALIAKVAGK